MCFKINCEANKNLLYIILVNSFMIINSAFYGLNNNEIFYQFKLIKSTKISSHILIRFFFNYFFILLVGLCLYLYELRKNNSNRPSIGSSHQKKLIYNNPEDATKTDKVAIFSLILYVIWIIDEVCLEIFIVSFKDVDCWMFELIFLVFLYSKINKNKEIYSHQWFAILFIVFSFILKIISIILTLTDNEKNKKYELDLPILYRTDPIFLLGFFIYLFLIFLRASVNVGLNWIMETKYTSENKIFYWNGFIGTFISIICIIISNYNPHEGNIDQNNNDYYKYIFRINENNSYYLENINIYFDDFNWKAEIPTIFFGSLTFLSFRYYSLLLIQKSNPIFFSISIPITFFFQKVINVLDSFYNNYNNNRKFFKENSDDNSVRKIKCALDVVGDIIAIIGFLIYLEKIVLNYKIFKYNIEENIIDRGIKDTKLLPDETIYYNETVES